MVMLNGTSGMDFQEGSPDEDTLQALSGSDTVLGLEGDENASGNTGDDWIGGKATIPSMAASTADTVRGGKDNDLLFCDRHGGRPVWRSGARHRPWRAGQRLCIWQQRQ